MADSRPASRRLLLWFAATTVPATMALVWLGWVIVRQDRLLARDRQEADLEQAADVGVAALARTLAEFERSLSSAGTPQPNPPESSLVARTPILTFDGQGVVARVGLKLPYCPAVSRPVAVLPGPFALADELEFVQNDARGASRIVLPFARSEQRPATRAEAWIRLARTSRKSGDLNAALGAFQELSRLDDTTVQGLPAGLMGRTGRALLFASAGRTRELREEATGLLDDLAAGRWRLTEVQFETSIRQVARWLGRDVHDVRPGIDAERAGLLVAANAIWHETVGVDRFDPRRTMWVDEASILALARPAPQGVAVMLVSASVLQDAWRANLPAAATAVDLVLTDAGGHDVVGTMGPDRRKHAVRTMAASGLPWTLTAADRAAAPPPGLSPRARLLLAGAGLMVLVVISSGHAILRAVSREMRVARLQTDFVAAVSHEFRTPLTTIRQLSEMLAQSRVSSSERRQQFYEALLNESDRLQRLVEGLLDFGRMEAGKLAFRLEPLDLRSLVREVTASVGRDAPPGYRIEVDEPDEVPRVCADRDAIGHAVRNLLDNAIKYSPEQRTIRVSVATVGDRVSISVRDRGLGIPLAEQREIFEKFVRGAGSAARNIAGTGVGLAMARQIVEAHRGTIAVESAPGEGSTFTIDLPAEPAAGL
jgi:two-component system, OmpR family, phosphate regulon sensor histidine kinase PhoR